MISILKKLLIACLLLSVMLVACSCGGSGDNGGGEGSSNVGNTEGEGNGSENKATYKVTVVDQNGAPLKGATVQLCVGSICKLPSITGDDGVATFTDFDKLPYSVKVNLGGYVGEKQSYEFDLTSTELKVKLIQKFTYKVTVVDENDAPLKGATVQLCVGDLCKLPTLTGDNGVATFTNFDEAEYTIKVTFDNYTYEVPYGFEEGSYELTVKFTK